MSSLRLNNSNDIVVNSIRIPVNREFVNVADYLNGTAVTAEDLFLKADKTQVHNKPQFDTCLNGKANTGVSYTIVQSDAHLL